MQLYIPILLENLISEVFEGKNAKTTFVEDVEILQAHHLATIRPSDNILLEPDLTNDYLDIHLANAVIDPDTGAPLEYRQLIHHPRTDIRERWHHSAANEFGLLTQGVGTRIKGTNTIFFIPANKLPKNQKATYARFVCDHRPQKTEKLKPNGDKNGGVK